MKKVLTILVIVGLGWFVAKKTNAVSYARTAWASLWNDAENEVPTRFEIKRVRGEIALLDGDIDKLIRPMAEYMAHIGKLEGEILKDEATLAKKKTSLLTMVHDFDVATTTSAKGIESKIKKGFDAFRDLENEVASKRKLLEAKQTALAGAQEQMEKILAKKREFEVRLAELEAEEESLAVEKLGSSLAVDQSRTTHIEAALEKIKHRHSVTRNELKLRSRKAAEAAVVPPAEPQLDVAAIRRHLEGVAAGGE